MVVGNDQPQYIAGKIAMCIYAVTVIFMLANIFIATLNDFFSAAVNRINIEMSAEEAQDPIDYVIMNTRGGAWKIFGILYNFATRSRRKGDNKVGPDQQRDTVYFTGMI